MNLTRQRQHLAENDGDTSNKHQIEGETSLLEQKLRLATSAAGLGAWEWDIKRHRLFWDARMLEMHAQRAETFPGDFAEWVNCIHPEDQKRVGVALHAALSAQRDFDISYRVAHPNGTVRHLKANGWVLLGADGTPERIIGANADVTDRIVAEEEKERLLNQLHQSQKMESIGLLAGGVAHDFNNKLSIIIGNAEMALMQMDQSHPAYKHLEEIKWATGISAELTNQLLAFASKQRVSPRVLELNSLVQRILKTLDRIIGEGVELVFEAGANTWPVKIDPAQLDQILVNLCLNCAMQLQEMEK